MTNSTLEFGKVTLEFGPSGKRVEVGDVVNIFTDRTLKLECGAEIKDFPMAYKTFGKLNETKSNAVLICHALTGDQYMIGKHPVTDKDGWWENYCGSGKAIDTDELFLIVPNVLGGCMGSFGPKSTNPETGKPYGLDFPIITITDMVRAQEELVRVLGIEKLACVIGGSMGGMQALEWISKFSDKVGSAVLIATSAKHSAQNIAFNEIGRQAIMADEGFKNGKYFEHDCYPSKGLSIARMTAHITYLSEDGLQTKFGRNLQDKKAVSFGFDVDFQVESYLRYQGMNFVERFDPNSYLYITRAMDYFDLSEEYKGDLAKAFEKTNCPVLVMSFSSDWLFTTEDAKTITRALSASSSDVSFVNITSDKGHDSFLIPDERIEKTIHGFLTKITDKK